MVRRPRLNRYNGPGITSFSPGTCVTSIWHIESVFTRIKNPAKISVAAPIIVANRGTQIGGQYTHSVFAPALQVE